MRDIFNHLDVVIGQIKDFEVGKSFQIFYFKNFVVV